MSPRVPALVRLRAGIVLLVAAVAPLVAGVTCSTPSEDVDAGDLLGVFDRDASADAAADARVKPAKSASPRAATAPAGSASARAPSDTACVAPDGTPSADTRRTVGRPACRDAQILEWKDPDGAPRYACVISPRGAETRAPLPLVVFFHGAFDDPTAVDKKTALRKFVASFDLTGDPSHQGFIVLAPQGRAIKGGKLGAVFDTDYTGADNVDVLTTDHFVEELVAKGLVDRRRVYALGASYGGLMASTWAMMRADRVAAFAVYGSDTPHAAWTCAGPPPPALVLYRACDDFFACDSVERWLRARDAASAETASVRLGAGNEDEPSCAVRNKCSKTKGQANHRRWPKGREDGILRFFARHTLAINPSPSTSGPLGDAGDVDGAPLP